LTDQRPSNWELAGVATEATPLPIKADRTKPTAPPRTATAKPAPVNSRASRIAVALELELVGAEAARQTERPDALDYIFRGRAALSKPLARDNYAEAINLFERALALDPRSVAAQSWLGNALTGRVLDQMTDSAEADIAHAECLAAQALGGFPRSPLAHYTKGQVLRAQRRHKEAIPEFEITLALNRNWMSTLAALGWCKLFSGSIEETIPLEEQAIRLSPRDPYICTRYGAIGLVHLLRSHNEEAIIWLEKARSANSKVPPVLAWLASAYSLNGETEAPPSHSPKPTGWAATTAIRASPG
jgi:tetratricopeptide (TPR) repeat protein